MSSSSLLRSTSAFSCHTALHVATEDSWNGAEDTSSQAGITPTPRESAPYRSRSTATDAIPRHTSIDAVACSGGDMTSNKDGLDWMTGSTKTPPPTYSDRQGVSDPSLLRSMLAVSRHTALVLTTNDSWNGFEDLSPERGFGTSSNYTTHRIQGGSHASSTRQFSRGKSPTVDFILDEHAIKSTVNAGSIPLSLAGMSPKETSRLLRQKSSDFEASHAMAGVTSPSSDDDLSNQAVNGLLDMETPIPDMELCITSDGHLDVWKETRVFLCMCPCYWFRFLVAQLALDTELIFVGHLGVPQLAGVGLVRFWVAIPFWFLYSSMRAVYVFGVQARQHGIDRTAGLWLQTGLGFAFIGTVAVIIYYLRSPDMARFAEFNDVTIAFAREYAPIILLGLFPCLAFAAMDNFMRVQGITLPALVCATIACVLNITLHFVFIFGAFGWSGRGFVGSPWATVTSLVVQLILYVAYTVAIKRYHAPFWCEWSWESHRFGQYRLFWKVAAPLGGAAMVLAIAFCIIGTITSYVPPTAATPTRVLRQLDDADVDAGSERAGAWVISFCLFFVVVAIFLGVAETTKIRMLVYFANGRPQLARKVLYVGLAYGVAIAAVFVALLLVYKSVVFRIWTNDTGVLAQCIDVVRWIGVCLMFASMRTVLASGLIVLQKRPMVVLAQTLDIWCCQVPCSFVLPILLNFPGLNGFWIAVATGECVHVLLLLYALCQTGGTIDDLALMEVVQAVVVNQRHLAANQDMEGLKHGNYGRCHDDPHAIMQPLLLPEATVVKEVAVTIIDISYVQPNQTDAVDNVAITTRSSSDESASVVGAVASRSTHELLESARVLFPNHDSTGAVPATPSLVMALEPSRDELNCAWEGAPTVCSAMPLRNANVLDHDITYELQTQWLGLPATASTPLIDLHGESLSRAASAVDPTAAFALPRTANESNPPWTSELSKSKHSTTRSCGNSDESLSSSHIQIELDDVELSYNVKRQENPSARTRRDTSEAQTALSSMETRQSHDAPSASDSSSGLNRNTPLHVDPVEAMPLAPTGIASVPIVPTFRRDGEPVNPAHEEVHATAAPPGQAPTEHVTLSTKPCQPNVETHPVPVAERPTDGLAPSTKIQTLDESMDCLASQTTSEVVVQRDIANMATSTKDASIDAADERVLLPLHPSHGPRVQSRTQPDAAPVDMELAISLRGILPPSATTALSFSPQLCTKSPMSSDAGSEASEDGAAPVHSNMDETGSVASSTGKPRRRPKSSNGPLPPSGQVETLGGVDIATLQFGKRSKKRRTREEKLRRVMSTSPARRPSASSFQASLD
ncbi:hypothetical protein H310_01018 [Aphanomyces invadans]|uniref:MATE efflux family protein n=1 Tax=Aphanomyces invadans TaxID=157072 RepID=A0A024UPV7_9STRA|nr:hypothetical protein H310_01018 [Aphanomyces invadans]ETW08436.1 hypothetical protein H310_01018 [Aphanomyces invadans]|eukprot:XP_008862241.1 hypothetical protein H310_01018 [Aphanomyces invadans]